MRRARGYDDEPGWLAREVETLKAAVKRRDAGAGVEIRGVSQKAETAQESAATAQSTATTAQSAAQSAQYAAAQATTQAELAVSAAEQAQADLATAQTQIGGDITAVVDSVKDGTVFEADTFTGVVLTGALLQTLADASRGIKIIGNDLVGYDDGGELTFHVDGDTGQVTIAGALIAGAELVGAILKTAASGLRAEIGNLGGNASAIRFFSGLSQESLPGRVEANSYTQSGNTIGEVLVRGPSFNTGPSGYDPVLALGRNSGTGSGASLQADDTSIFGNKKVAIGTNALDPASEVVITSPKVTINGKKVVAADAPAQVASTSDYTVTASVVQVPGLSVSASGTVFTVHVAVDLSILNADNVVTWNLFVDGSAFGASTIAVFPGITRAPTTRTFVVSGLTAGSHTFSVRVSRSGTAGGSIVRGTHSTLAVDPRG